MSAFAHPTTGEALESHDDFLAALDALERDMQPMYRLRRQLRIAMAERHPMPDILPAPRERTQTQERAAECPRCGGRLPNDDALKALRRLMEYDLTEVVRQADLRKAIEASR